MKTINTLPPFKRLCVTIGNLPSSYVDSMSYYECIMWLCKYLKDTVVPTVNENAEAVNELINWFNNLDVQEEINNKLDEMAESGELEEIISVYLNSTAVFGFENVANMKLAENLVDGSYAKTMGYYSKNDGGSSLYKIRTRELTDVIDEGSLIAIGDNLVAELIYLDSVNYKQFGAKGDGSSNDYQYLYNTHVFANDKNLKVYGNPEDTYYIGLCEYEIPVYTSVDFRNAKMIIDDTVEGLTYDEKEKSIFRIKSRNEEKNLDLSTISSDTTNINISGLGIKSMAYVEIENAYKKQYIRSGSNSDTGKNQFDNFRVDSYGRIIDPVLWDFETITSAKIKEIDDDILEFKNLQIETIVNEEESIYDYYWRNIRCVRSNTVIDNIIHTLSNENNETSKPYEGILYIASCCNVLVKDCQLSAHKIFYTQDTVPMGNYDIRLDKAINIKLDNCNQLNSITDTSKWGVYTSNYCKNLTISNSILNRFDAHKGVANATIENSILGYQGIQCVGFGDLIVNNTKFLDTKVLIKLRDDYGSFWKGNIKLNNIISECKYPSKKDERCVIDGRNDGTHDYGYTCYYPNIYIDGIEYHNAIDDTFSHFSGISIFYIYSSGKGDITNSYNPIMGKEFIIKNAKCEAQKSGFHIFGGLSDIELNKLYCENNSLLEGRYTNDYYSRQKALDLTPNFNVIIDNVDMHYQSSDSHDILGVGDPTVSTIYALYTSPSKRLLPNISVYNCKQVVSKTNYPAIYNFYNCEVDRIITPSNGENSLALVNFNNCVITLANYIRKLEEAGNTITYSYLNNTKIVSPANDKTSFNNCYFKGLEEYQTLDQTVDSNLYRRVIFMFSFINTIESNKYLRNGYDLVGCEFSDQILYVETNENKKAFGVEQYFNSYMFSEELGLIPRKVGSTSQQPTAITISRSGESETVNLYEGMTYVNSTNHTYEVYLNGAWKSVTVS